MPDNDTGVRGFALRRGSRRISPPNVRGCKAEAEVMTPDAILRTISCGKFPKRHGRWHENRGVRWRGRYEFPENIGEASERLLRSAIKTRNGTKATP
jgi:hypothetical protein